MSAVDILLYCNFSHSQRLGCEQVGPLGFVELEQLYVESNSEHNQSQVHTLAQVHGQATHVQMWGARRGMMRIRIPSRICHCLADWFCVGSYTRRVVKDISLLHNFSLVPRPSPSFSSLSIFVRVWESLGTRLA